MSFKLFPLQNPSYYFSKEFLQSFLKSSLYSIFVVTFFTGLSRGLGFVRQILIFFQLEKIEADLILSANKVPEFLATFMVLGTIYSSVLPISSKIEHRYKSTIKVSKYLNLVMLFLTALMSFFILLLMVFTRPILDIFTGEKIWQIVLEEGRLEEYVLTTRILALIPILSTIQSILGVYLNLKKKFLIFSLNSVLVNVGSILGLLVSGGSIVVVACGMVIGWLVADILFFITCYLNGYHLPLGHFVKQLRRYLALQKNRFQQNLQKTATAANPARLSPVNNLNLENIKISEEDREYDIGLEVKKQKQISKFDSLKKVFKLEWQDFKNSIQIFKTDLQQTLRLFLPRIFLIDGFYMSTLLINPFPEDEGQITALDLGTSVAGALFIICVSIATVAFPHISKSYHSHKMEQFWKQFRFYLLASIGTGLLATVLAFGFSPVFFLLQRLVGQSGQGNEQYITQIAQFAALSLTFRATKETLSRYFFVRERMWQPVILSLVGVLVQVIFTLNLFFQTDFDHGLAVALGMLAYNIVWNIIAGFMLWKDYKKDLVNDSRI